MNWQQTPGMRARLFALASSTPALLGCLWFAWGSTFVAVKMALRWSGPDTLALWRAVIATVVLGGVLGVRRAADGAPSSLGGWKIQAIGLVLGLTNVAGMQILVNLGMLHAPAGVSALIIYTQPMLVVVVARILLKERLTMRKVAGLAVGWLGIVGLVAGELNVGRVEPLSVVLLLSAAGTWTAGTIFYKVVSPEPASLPRLLLLQNVYGLIPLAVVAVAVRSPTDWNWELVLAVLWAGVFGSVGGFGVQYVLLRRGEAGVVSALSFGAPIVGAVLSVIILAEPVQVGLIVGCAGVALGIWLLATYVRHPDRVEG